MAGRTLVITNDFPPRTGGIESFVLAMVSRMPADSVVVMTARQPGDRAFDETLGFPVLRHPAGVLLPSPAVTRQAVEAVRRFGVERVWFGAAAPLGLMAGALRAAGVRRMVATTHGHEVWWARVPVMRRLLRRIGDTNDVLTYLGEFTRARIAPALSADAAARMVRLTPGVDDAAFRPGCGGAAVRASLGLGDRPVVVCVSRMVARKGQDMLVRALPLLQRQVPDAALLFVGDGPARRRVESLVDSLGVRSSVRFAGEQPWSALPPYFDAGDVFCMPTRTRKLGLEVEGLGIVYLEASATGLPVVAGRSGGAPDAVLDGETGFVVDGRSQTQIAARLSDVLLDRELAGRLGAAGRQWVEREWRWDDLALRLQGLLDSTRPAEAQE